MTDRADPFACDPVKSEDHARRVSDFARSAVFLRLFREGMALVEEAAAYLDGPGRAAAKSLPRSASLIYAGESMRLTTRLMQAASWLMVQRAVREGELTPAETLQEKFRLSNRPDTAPFAGADTLPEGFRDLSSRADGLLDRIRRFDATLNTAETTAPANPVANRLAQIEAAFEAFDRG